MHTVHNLLNLSMSEAYDYTQYSDTVKNGDTLIVSDGVGVMMNAWPAMLTGTSEVFHAIKSEYLSEIASEYPEAWSDSQVDVHQLLERAVTCAGVIDY
jgi:hypothetical protein